MPLRKLCIVVLMVSASLTSLASVSGSSLQIPNSGASVTLREHQIWASAVHDSEFAAIPRTAHTSCAAAQPPQALATPNPRLDQPDANKITMSFIIGVDGRAHSPQLLECAAAIEHRNLFAAVRVWRCIAAPCTGLPAT